MRLMRKRSMLLLVIAAAALTLSLTAAVASANRLSVDDQDFTFTWNDPDRLTYIGGFESNIECEVTLAGSFTARSFSKIRGTQIGSITSALIDSGGCIGGAWTFLDETLPWTMHYRAFTGSLPQIEAVRVSVLGYTYLVAEIGSSCVSRSTAEEPVVESFLLDESGTALLFSPDENYEIRGTDLPGSFLCDSGFSMQFDGTPGVVEDGEEGTVSFTLI
jgi:hypothetical protein